jgi:O-antigen/teichoic acid export membrane protein
MMSTSSPSGNGPPAGQSRQRPSFREAFSFSTLSVVLGGILGLASTIVVARLYGISVIGEFALATAPQATVSLLSTVAERPALIRALAVLEPRDPRVTGLFLAVLTFSASLTTVVAALGVVGTVVLFNGPIGQPDLIAPAVITMLGYLVFGNTGFNIDAILVAFRAGRELFWVRLNMAVVYLLVAIVASFFADSVWSLIVATIASMVTSLLQRVWYVRPWMRFVVASEPIRAGFRTLPELIRFGLKVAPGKLAQGGAAMSGTWVLGLMSSVATVGAWNRAWTLGNRFLNLQSRVSEMVLPTLVERQASGDERGFDRALIDSIRYTATLFFLPAAVGGGAAVSVMALFGSGFDRASGALALILAVPTLSLMTMLQTQALLAVDRPFVTSLLSVMRLVVTVATIVPLTIAIGLTGTALGMLIGCVVLLGAQFACLRRHLSGPVHRYWPYRNIIAVGLAYAAGFGAARAVDMTLDGPLGLLVAMAAGSIGYIGCILIAGGVLPRDLARLAGPLRRLGDRRGFGGWATRMLRASVRA